MRARERVLVVPDTPRYARVALADFGEHVLRTPTFAASAVARECLYACMARTEVEVLTIGWTEELSPGFGACVGVSWWHPELELESPRPALSATPEAWEEYGDAVCDELIEQGYGIRELTTLGLAAKERVELLANVAAAAEERAGFSSSPEAGDGTTEGEAGARETA